MQKTDMRNIIRLLALALVLIVVLLCTGCNSKENNQDDKTDETLLSTIVASGEAQNTADEYISGTELIETNSSIAVDSDVEKISDDKDSALIETDNATEISETPGYDNGIELPDHNWD